MPLDNEIETPPRTVYLDGTLLELNPKEETFLKEETGIQDTDELRKHITEVQKEAYKVSSYSRYSGTILSGNIGYRFTPILVFVGLDSRNSRVPGCLCTHTSSNWRRAGQMRYFWMSGAAVRISSYLEDYLDNLTEAFAPGQWAPR